MNKISKQERDKIRKAINKKRRRRRKRASRQSSDIARAKLRAIGQAQSKIENEKDDKNDENENKESAETEQERAESFLEKNPQYNDLIDRFISTNRVLNKEVERLELEKAEQEKAGLKANEEKAIEEEEEPEVKQVKLSKRELKKRRRIPVAQLKVLVDRPDLVEAWDVTAKDPLLLLALKSYKNTVLVPKHWSQKRKFLQNKRGGVGCTF